jgi:hypothetical protein
MNNPVVATSIKHEEQAWGTLLTTQLSESAQGHWSTYLLERLPEGAVAVSGDRIRLAVGSELGTTIDWWTRRIRIAIDYANECVQARR